MSTAILRNHVQVEGRGPPMVFAHGFGCDQTVWRRLAPRFVDTHRVVTFDHVGSGRSNRSAFDPQRYATLHGYADDLVDIGAALELEGAVLVAHSVSSMIGLLAAIRAPRLFSKMILLAPSPRFENDPPDYHGGFSRSDLEGLLRMLDANFFGWASALSQMALDVPSLAAELKDSLCSGDPQALRVFARAAFLSDHRAELARVPVPCLVVQCARDDLAPVPVGRYIVERIPQASWALLDVPGHMPHMSHPSEVERVIRGYIVGARVAGA